MSRTYKDMPERVQLTRHRSTAPKELVREFHNCAPHAQRRIYAARANREGYRPCDIEEILPPDANSWEHCHYTFDTGWYFSKPDYSDAVRDQMNKPLRNRERKFAAEAVKEHRAGFDNPGGDRDVLIPRPTQHGPLGGGYWH